jgi:alpha-ribazole phosphatase
VKLMLIRHSKPLVQDGMCYGMLDVPACPQAVQQDAEALAKVVPLGCPIMVSALARAQHLASALLAHRPDLTLFNDPRLNEMHFGTWEGRLWSDISKADMDEWTSNFMHHRVGGGESLADVLHRVADALKAAQTRHEQVVWLTHAGVIKAVYCLQRNPNAAEALQAHEWPTSGLGVGQYAFV